MFSTGCYRAVEDHGFAVELHSPLPINIERLLFRKRLAAEVAIEWQLHSPGTVDPKPVRGAIELNLAADKGESLRLDRRRFS